MKTFKDKNVKLKIISLSDIHLFHRLVPTGHIVQNLYTVIPDDGSLADVDIIFIAGDVFDRSVTLHHPDIPIVIEWIKRLFYICEKYDIVLRVLEGTPGHDWKQSQLFVDIHTAIESKCDFRYVQLLEIENIAKFNINVLYVPDEWRARCCDTWSDIETIMTRQNLSQVDFVVLHGAFPHQLPQLWDGAIEMHNPDNFLSITKYIIFIGHIHKFSHNQKFLSHGSFDRLAHGEEEDKGYIIAYVFEDDSTDFQFIVNKNAYTFKTLDLSGKDMDECDSIVNSEVNKLNGKEGYIRIKAGELDIATALYSKYVQQFRNVTFSFKQNTSPKDKQIVDPLADKRDFKNLPKLNVGNIKELLLERIKELHGNEISLDVYAKEIDEAMQ